MPTYSFADVNAAIQGPGGAFSIGAGSGVASEGITVEMADDKDNMVIGADGKSMHNLRASQAGNVTVRLLKTSPVNSKLQTLYNYQQASSANWGSNVITINNPATGDVIVAQDAAFRRQPSVGYATDGAMIEWSFNCGNVVQNLGDNVIAA